MIILDNKLIFESGDGRGGKDFEKWNLQAL